MGAQVFLATAPPRARPFPGQLLWWEGRRWP